MAHEKALKICVTILRGFLILGLGVLWTFGCLFALTLIAFSAFLPMVSIPMLFLAWLGGIVALAAWLFRRKKGAWIALAMVLSAFAIEGGALAWCWWTKWRYEPHVASINEWEYRPFREGNKLVVPTLPVPERLAGTLPVLNGAYALYPVYAAVFQAIYPQNLKYSWEYIDTTGSDRTFELLNRGAADLIFSPAPSEKQLEAAKAAGISYEMTPFGREAFVFFVHKDNPVSGLTSEQIRGIYSGKITNWKSVGASDSEKIIAFQRNEGSGSQTMLERIMGNVPLLKPDRELVSGGMGDIIERTAEYRNKHSALGFSFRFYTQGIMYNENLKLLAIDGIAPTKENIENGTYPFVADFYMISSRPRSENTRKVVDFVLSPTGREIVEKTGYVFYSPTAEPHVPDSPLPEK